MKQGVEQRLVAIKNAFQSYKDAPYTHVVLPTPFLKVVSFKKIVFLNTPILGNVL